MRSQFPGYFTPSEKEFAELWTNCIFAFDANVLLGLYRSTTETQEVFFSVLEKITSRIFLPHQAASEYLGNRLNAISFRSDQYGKIKTESEKLANAIESIVQEHAVLNGNDISGVARDFAKTMGGLVDSSAEKEPDLLRSDDVLARLADLFENCTGEPYAPERQKEIYALGAQRYAQAVPPGYKDDKKGDPTKYGDLLIWFQLIDHALTKKKPIVFITGDVKEDWLQQHRGETVGPRPELRQEMMASAGAAFWMYTTPRFLEFAKQFLGLKFDTKKAESEFEKIEKQDKQASEQVPIPQVTYHYTDFANSDFANLMNESWPDSSTAPFFSRPLSVQFSTKAYPYAPSTVINSTPNQRFLELLPINGSVFDPPTGKWTCEIVAAPETNANDHASYMLKFEPQDHTRPSRSLRLWVSVASLENDPDWRYKRSISGVIMKWLGGGQSAGEISLLP
jgi:hypothetical protein